jgi:hypothetical protein
VLGAGVFGLFLGVVWAFAKEGLTRLSNNPEHSKLEVLKRLISPEKEH